jgi:hypothetical protein
MRLMEIREIQEESKQSYLGKVIKIAGMKSIAAKDHPPFQVDLLHKVKMDRFSGGRSFKKGGLPIEDTKGGQGRLFK